MKIIYTHNVTLYVKKWEWEKVCKTVDSGWGERKMWRCEVKREFHFFYIILVSYIENVLQMAVHMRFLLSLTMPSGWLDCIILCLAFQPHLRESLVHRRCQCGNL